MTLDLKLFYNLSSIVWICRVWHLSLLFLTLWSNSHQDSTALSVSDFFPLSMVCVYDFLS